MSYFFKALLFCASIFSFNTNALNSQAIEHKDDFSIKELYHSLNALPNTSMSERINWFSKHYLGTVYVLGSLGEGANARYDQFPRYRTDAFDCDTYVNTVLALALADSLTNFHQCINDLRYKDGKVSYINRKHFTSIDWNDVNQQMGLFKDITMSIHDKKDKPVAVYTSVLIDKPSWYAHKDLSTIRISSNDQKLQTARLNELKAKGRNLEIIKSKVPYLPFTALFSEKKPNLYLFSQIPDGAIIEIVRSNWDLRKQIGTFLDISHLGFVFWEKGTLYFRQASSNYEKVVEVPLIEYLQGTMSSPTIKGINVQIVLPHHAGACKGH